MDRLFGLAIWLSLFLACAGTFCIVAFILGEAHDSRLLLGAGVAALLGLSAQLGALVFTFRSRSRGSVQILRGVLLQTEVGECIASPLSEQFEQRQKVLENRLKIDERRFCVQAQAPCASWSFCTSTREVIHSSLAERSHGGHVLKRLDATANHENLPIINRSGGIPASCLALARR